MIKPNKLARNRKLLVQLNQNQSDGLNTIERDAIARFEGNIGTLTSALGFLRLGYQIGWRVLVLTHNKRTVRKYEDILGISVREYFPKDAPGAERSIGLKMAKAAGNFWKVVSGDLKIEDKREIS